MIGFGALARERRVHRVLRVVRFTARVTRLIAQMWVAGAVAAERWSDGVLTADDETRCCENPLTVPVCSEWEPAAEAPDRCASCGHVEACHGTVAVQEAAAAAEHDATWAGADDDVPETAAAS